MAFKLVISDPKTGESYQTDFEDKSKLVGKRIGEKIPGSELGISGYKFELTGGSDRCGNPIRSDVDGAAARRLLLTGGIGFKPKEKGERRKKRVHGRVISGNIVQLNLKVVKEGGKSLDKLLSSEESEEEKEKKETKEQKEKPPKKEKEEKKEKPAEKEKEKKKEDKGKDSDEKKEKSNSKSKENKEEKEA